MPLIGWSAHESNDGMCMDGPVIVTDHDTTTTKGYNDQKECDDERKEKEPPIICKLDATDVGNA